MRILIAGLNFYPELTGIGKYTGEMAAHLQSAGHHVRVITAPPYYPDWRIHSGHHAWAYRRESWRDVQIYRTPLWVPRAPTGVKRLLHLISFACGCVPALFMQIPWRPDLVLGVAPAFTSAPFAWITARLSGARAWLHIQDFELDAATGLGILPSGGLSRFAAAVETWILKRFDRVSTISERMCARLIAKGVKPERVALIPNWVDTEVIFPLPTQTASLRKNFGIPPDKLVVLYSGSMGVKQGLDTLAAAARDLQQRPELLFVFCGQGSGRAALERSCRDLANVRFLPLQPAEQFNALLNAADIHVLPQRADAADLVMPSKLAGMLASGKAVIVAATPGSQIATIAGGAARLVPPEDATSLAAAVAELADSPSLRAALGEKGRALAVQNWSAGVVLRQLEALIAGG